MELALLDGHFPTGRQLQRGAEKREGAKGRRRRSGVGTRGYGRRGRNRGVGLWSVVRQEVHGEALSRGGWPVCISKRPDYNDKYR